MNGTKAFNGVVAARRVAARALLLVSALSGVFSCVDSDPNQFPPSSQAGAPSSSDGGSVDATAGEGGAPTVAAGGEAGRPDLAAGEGGMSGSGGSGAGGDAGAPNSSRFCVQDSDCDDGLYCNGHELCKQLSPGSDAKVCMRPEQGPCGPSPCDETTKCDCSKPDQDGDGFKVEGCTSDKNFDCDDTTRDRHPGNAELCDDIDQDCSDQTFGTKDSDSDTFFDQACTNKLRYQPYLFTLPQPLTVGGTDCDDNNPFVHPGAVEVCDNLDNNCNGQVDEVSGGQGDPHTYYQDQDGDYWGNDAKPLATLCNFPPPGYSILHGDCNDQDPRVSPDREEICNGIDDDCDGKIDQPDKPGDLMFGQPYDGVTDFECKGTAGWDVKQCPAGRLDCDASYLDACETVATTLCNCHACGKTCAFSCGDTDCAEIATLSTGETHTCAIVAPVTGISAPSGKIACWGRNALGQLGDGTTKDSTVPGFVEDLTGASAIALGQRHSCAIASGAVYCWGNNMLGQLGASSVQLQSADPLRVSAKSTWGKPTSLASGRDHACAIFEPGLLACWGTDDSGQLGNDDEGPQVFSYSPVQVRREVNSEQSFILNATQVVAGDSHSCALAAGKVECWGDNSYGQLGESSGSVTTRPVAKPVPGLEGIVVDELVAGTFHTCARSGTAVYCWGDNYFGELASDDQTLTSVTQISLPTNTVAIAAGSYFGCALGSNGVAQCWGSNDFGQRGAMLTDPGIAPTPIPLPNIAGIFGGTGSDVCARTNDAKAWCWGRNDFGQLGNGTQTGLDPQPTAKQINPLKDARLCSF